MYRRARRVRVSSEGRRRSSDARLDRGYGFLPARHWGPKGNSGYRCGSCVRCWIFEQEERRIGELHVGAQRRRRRCLWSL